MCHIDKNRSYSMTILSYGNTTSIYPTFIQFKTEKLIDWFLDIRFMLKAKLCQHIQLIFDRFVVWYTFFFCACAQKKAYSLSIRFRCLLTIAQILQNWLLFTKGKCCCSRSQTAILLCAIVLHCLRCQIWNW